MDVITSHKRLATRKALMDAARDMVFEKGHDRISVQEITRRAQVATGTYYNYFDTKQDIFIAVAADIREQLTADLAPAREATMDPAMRVAMTLRYYFSQSADNRDWRRFINFTGLTHLSLQQPREQRIEDIHAGVKGGRFKVDDIHFTEGLISGMVQHVSTALEKGHTGRTAIDYAIRSILQMLGLPEIVAKALAQTPLPQITPQQRPTTVETTKAAADASVTSLSDYQKADQIG